MSVQSLIYAPQNAIVVVLDEGGGDVPKVTRETPSGWPIWASKSCVVVGCLPDVDGPTSFSFGPAAELLRNEAPVFDAFIETPTRQLIVGDSAPKTLFFADVADPQTRIRVWVNHKRLPDKVAIGYG